MVVIIIAVNKEIFSLERQLLIGQSEVDILIFGFVLLVRFIITNCVRSEAYIPMSTILLFVRLTDQPLSKDNITSDLVVAEIGGSTPFEHLELLANEVFLPV